MFNTRNISVAQAALQGGRGVARAGAGERERSAGLRERG